MPASIARIHDGLIYRDGFSSSTGWTAGAGFVFSTDYPAYLTFDPLPSIVDYSVGSSSDGGGVRELHLHVEGGTYWLFYGAGSASGGAWRIHLATSTDGLTWTKLGPLNIQLQTGVGGNFAARDMLYLEKRSGVYYLHAMSASSASGNGVPISPYESQMWTNTALGTTGWAYQNIIVETGDLGNGTDDDDEYSGCVVLDGSTYHLFTSTKTGTSYGTGHFTGTGPNGPWTPHATVPNPVTIASGFGGENPKVFWSTALDKWVMFITTFPYPAGNSFSQSMVTSDDLVTWTPSVVPGLVMQAQSAIHGATAGANILSPAYAPDGLPVIDSNSYVACTYDTQPSGILDAINSGRQGRFVVAEPAAACLAYEDGGSELFADDFNSYTAASNMNGQGGWTQATGSSGSIVATGTQCNLGSGSGDKSIVQSGGPSVTNGTILLHATLGNTCSIGVIVRYVSNTDFILLDIGSDSGRAQYIAYSGGTSYTSLGTTVQGGAGSWVADTTHEVRVEFEGLDYSVFVDGVLLGTFTGGSAVAGYIGLRNGQSGTGNRLVDDIVLSEPSAPETAYRTLAHDDFTAEFAVEFDSLSGSVGFDYHVQDEDNLMRLVITPGDQLSLDRIVGGTVATMPRGFGSQNASAGRLHYVRLKVYEGRIRAWLDGELQIDYLEGTYYSGAEIGFYVAGAAVKFRELHLRRSDTVVIDNLLPGNTVIPRSPGGLPVGAFTVGEDGIVEFSSEHFPLSIVSDEGDDVSPSGNLIWGGDHFRREGDGAGAGGGGGGSIGFPSTSRLGGLIQ